MKNRMTHLIPIKVIELHQFLFFPITLSFLSNQKRKRLKEKKIEEKCKCVRCTTANACSHTHTHSPITNKIVYSIYSIYLHCILIRFNMMIRRMIISLFVYFDYFNKLLIIHSIYMVIIFIDH